MASAKVNFRASQDPNISYLGRSVFEDSPTYPSVGIHYLNRGRNPASVFALQQELLFSKASFAGVSSETWKAGGYDFKETSTTTINYSKIDYRIGTRLSARSNTINPYIAFGLELTQFVGTESKSNITFQINDDIQQREYTPVANGSAGGWASAGLSKSLGKHQLFLDITIEKGSISNGGAYNTLLSRVGFSF